MLKSAEKEKDISDERVRALQNVFKQIQFSGSDFAPNDISVEQEIGLKMNPSSILLPVSERLNSEPSFLETLTRGGLATEHWKVESFGSSSSCHRETLVGAAPPDSVKPFILLKPKQPAEELSRNIHSPTDNEKPKLMYRRMGTELDENGSDINHSNVALVEAVSTKQRSATFCLSLATTHLGDRPRPASGLVHFSPSCANRAVG